MASAQDESKASEANSERPVPIATGFATPLPKFGLGSPAIIGEI